MKDVKQIGINWVLKFMTHLVNCVSIDCKYQIRINPKWNVLDINVTIEISE